MDQGVSNGQVLTLKGLFFLDLAGIVLLFIPIVIGLVIAFRDLALRLAQRADLPLPLALGDRLDRFLYVRRVVYLLTLVAVSQGLLFTLVLTGDDRRAGHVVELALLPAAAWLPCMLASLWPRWKSHGQVHLAHLRRLGVRDALTDREWATVLAAYCADGVLIGLALSRAGLATWSAVALASLVGQALLTFVIARSAMAQPAVGSNNLELAWDDVLRLARVRSLVASSSFVTLWFVAAAAGDLAGATVYRSPLFMGSLGGVAAFAVGIWNQSSAHQNWRRAWPSELPLRARPR
jgi:hypothetical protein